MHSETSEAPVALFAFSDEITFTINNGVTPNKAVGTLGAFEATAGNFAVSGSITAYFADVAAVAAVRQNSDVTMDMALVTGNAGAKTGIVGTEDGLGCFAADLIISEGQTAAQP